MSDRSAIEQVLEGRPADQYNDVLIADAAAELGRLLDFADHKTGCGIWDAAKDWECTCGYDDLMARFGREAGR